MQNVSHESKRVVKEPRPVEPVQLEDWENEGGAPTPAVVSETGSGVLRAIRRGLRGASLHLAATVRNRPVTALAATLALGLALGGGTRYLRSGRLLMAVAARPLFVLATGVLLKKQP